MERFYKLLRKIQDKHEYDAMLDLTLRPEGLEVHVGWTEKDGERKGISQIVSHVSMMSGDVDHLEKKLTDEFFSEI